jgi:hypothetical protein
LRAWTDGWGSRECGERDTGRETETDNEREVERASERERERESERETAAVMTRCPHESENPRVDD